jgi:hypothetical protein
MSPTTGASAPCGSGALKGGRVVWPPGGVWQAPWVQIRPAPQALPQAPQLAALLLRLTSQPLAASPSQSVSPALHAWQFVPV